MSEIHIDPDKIMVCIQLDIEDKIEKEAIDFEFEKAKQDLIKFLNKLKVKTV